MRNALVQQPDVVVVGGRFGWALTRALSGRHPDWVFLFVMRDHAKVDEAVETGLVDRFFGEKIRQAGVEGLEKAIALPGNVRFCSLETFNTTFRGSIQKLFIPSVSSNDIRTVLDGMLRQGVPASAFRRCEILAVSKGMETASLKQPHEIIADLLGAEAVIALGGNLAFEVAKGDPMLMELAGRKGNTRRVADFFSGSNLMICQSRNRNKLSLAGPMKNIHSLATGMASEIYGKSSVSTVATLGLAEYERAAFIIQFPEKLRALARALQKLPVHFRSVPIAGGAMSDYHLFRFTRNFEAGQAFVRLVRQGMDAAEAMAVIARETTIESFTSALPTRDYLKKFGIDCPVIETMARVLIGQISPDEGIDRILRRQNVQSS